MPSTFAQTILEENKSILESATGGAYCNNAAEIYTVLYEEETWQTDAVEKESKADQVENKIKERQKRVLNKTRHQCGLR